MVGLMVSVRSVDELQAALEGGAQAIDVKEPSRGALGAADPRVWREVAQALPATVPLSAALGELCDASQRDLSMLRDVRFAKVGLAGCIKQIDWIDRWQSLIMRLPPTTHAVAVAYADYERAASPPPEKILRAGMELGCRAFLCDTFDKSHGGLLTHLPLCAVAQLCQLARRHQMLVVLAGSLDAIAARRLRDVVPDWIAVRGAVCRQDRRSSIDASKVRALNNALCNASDAAEVA